VWNPASLRGRARSHHAVVHLIGGTRPDPARGLTFRHLNFVSARNVAEIAVRDAVPHFVLLSASAAPLGVSGEYIDSKREAEDYLKKTGLTWTIIRAAAYARRYCGAWDRKPGPQWRLHPQSTDPTAPTQTTWSLDAAAGHTGLDCVLRPGRLQF
jgi:nucleoside-diphosphate-sugar epimerase